MPEAVLFDLDGTLADTAPDLAGILAHLQLECGLTPTPFEVLRPQVSNGVRGLLGAGFGLTPDAPAYADLAQRFLTLYAASIYVETCLFPGISELLDSLDERGIAWGVVTNKAERFARPIIEALGLAGRSICVVGGDTVAQAHAAENANRPGAQLCRGVHRSMADMADRQLTMRTAASA